MNAIHEAYRRMRPVLDRATERLIALLQGVVGRIEDRKLVRVEFDNVRPKGRASLERKARAEGWSPDEALSRCPDLVGGRVLCNNVEDVYRFEALLRESLPFESAPVERQDYIETPKNGYRALHLNFRLDVGEPLAPRAIPCEVQIRSRLQHAWAELSHADIYKHNNLPPDLLARTVDLSRILLAADEIASDIRARARRITEPSEEQPRLDQATADALAYVFKDVFGRAPAEYVVAMALTTIDELDIRNLEPLPGILKPQPFRDKLNEAYTEMLHIPIESESLLIAGLHALATDEAAALRYVREQARHALDEIDDVARRELMSQLPGTAEELIDEIRDPREGTDVTLLAAALGAVNNCPYCNATVVDAFACSEAATYHYGLSGDEADRVSERILDAVFGSGADTGGIGDSDACSHCASVLGKDG